MQYPGTLNMVRLGSISVPLLCLMLQACSTSHNPLEPSPEPPGSVVEPPGPQQPTGPQQARRGAIDVSIAVTGEMPDPNGHLVVVRIGPGSSSDVLTPAPQEEAVPSTGGTVHFRDLPPGTYWVALQRFAPNCRSVQGANARPLALGEGETIQVAYTVACQSIDIPNLPGSVAGIYERTSPHWSGSIEFHGSLSERYVILGDGTFRLQYNSERWGFFEYSGSYSPHPLVGPVTALFLTFDADVRWSATATLRDNCLIVEYSLIASLSDFVDGEFCKS